MYILFLFQGESKTLVPSPGEIGIEQTVFNLVQWLQLAVEVTGAAIIGIGIFVTVYYLLRSLAPALDGYNRIRLTLSRYLALALEFQLGADILSTAIAPTWEQIGKLAAIALIRTALNFFLTREMREEREGLVPDAPIGTVDSEGQRT